MATTTRRRFTAYTNKPGAEAQRKRELGHIHQGSDFLGWSKDDYHYHLRNITGADSAAHLDAQGRHKMLAFMATLGYKPKSGVFKAFGQAEKIKWLWKQIGLANGLRDDSPAALLAFVGRATGVGVSDVKFLSTAQASQAIEALKAMLDRAKRAAAQKGTA